MTVTASPTPGGKGAPALPRVVVYSSAWRGGSGWFVQELARGIAEGGAEVTLISPEAEPASRDPKHPRLARIFLPQGAGGRGSKLHRALRAIGRIALTFLQILRGRFWADIFVVTMTDWLPVTVLQLIWIRLLGGKVLYIVHDVRPHSYGYPESLRWLERLMISWSYRLPNHIVTLTEAARREMIDDQGRAANRVTVIPHGAYAAGELTPLPGNSKVLVFGMLRRNKRIFETIEAMKRLPKSSRVRLIIAGEPHASDLDYWTACEAALEGLGDRIRCEIGFVPEARVDELVAECDAFVLPYEAFSSQSGVAILGMMSGRLIVSTNVGGIGELIDAGIDAVQIDRPVTADAIADALARFEMLSIAERRRRAEALRSRLQEHLSWSRIGGEYVALLQKIVLRSNSTGHGRAR